MFKYPRNWIREFNYLTVADNQDEFCCIYIWLHLNQNESKESSQTYCSIFCSELRATGSITDGISNKHEEKNEKLIDNNRVTKFCMRLSMILYTKDDLDNQQVGGSFC